MFVMSKRFLGETMNHADNSLRYLLIDLFLAILFTFPARAEQSVPFAFDIEPPRANIIYSVTHALPIRHRFPSGIRVGFPYAPHANPNDIFDPPPRVRENDCVSIIITMTNANNQGTGNDSFRMFDRIYKWQLSDEIYTIGMDYDKPFHFGTLDLRPYTIINTSRFFSFDYPYPYSSDDGLLNTVTVTSGEPGKPDIITAIFSFIVSKHLGKTASTSREPILLLPSIYDDDGNLLQDRKNDPNIVLNFQDTGWVKDHPQAVLAIDNQGPVINPQLEIQLISGSACTRSASPDYFSLGDMLTDQAVIAPDSILRVTAMISDPVDHPLDLLAAQENFGEFALQTDSHYLPKAILDATHCIQIATDTVQVPFIIHFATETLSHLPQTFHFVVQATDTIGNATEIESVQSFWISPLDQLPQGNKPVVLSSVLVFYEDLEMVNQWNELPPKSKSINASAGNWLLYAALVQVDGTGDEEFVLDDFDLDWSERFEFDVERLEHDKHYKGKRIISETADQTILLVTNTIKVRDDADPRNATNLTVTMKDIHGNETISLTDMIAISSTCCTRTEINLKFDGKVQSIEGADKLGIGNKGIDSFYSKFEVYPGAQLIVEATITTIGGEAPDTILLDVSDLYPAGLKTMTDELIPSATQRTPDGLIYAKWEYLTYDFSNLLPRAADWADGMTPTDQRWFFDQGNLNWLAYGSEYSYKPISLYTPARRFNGPIPGATPSATIDLSGVTCSDTSVNGFYPSQFAMPIGGPKGKDALDSMQTVLNALEGLPTISVQKDATAKQIAWVTVTTTDRDSEFAPESGFSSCFAIDTEPPRASVIFSVTRALHTPYQFASGPRIGLPTAPHANSDDIFDPPPRVRENDCVAVIVSITNSSIDGKDNDRFRFLPGYLPDDLKNGFFCIDASNDASIRDVTIDLSEFSSLPGMENVSVFDPNIPVPFPDYPNLVTIDSQGKHRPDIITATFTVRVTGDRGLTVLESRTPVDVTPSVVDDAGNRPIDTAYDKGILSDHRDSSR